MSILLQGLICAKRTVNDNEAAIVLASQDYVPPTRSHVTGSHRDLSHGGKLVVLLELGLRKIAIDPVEPTTVRKYRQG